MSLEGAGIGPSRFEPPMFAPPPAHPRHARPLPADQGHLEQARVEQPGAGPSHTDQPRIDQHSEVFLDPRSGDRVLRVTWHPESDVVVLSLWRESTCVGTFRLGRESVTPFVDALLDGLAEPRPQSTASSGDVVRTGAVDDDLRDVARARQEQPIPVVPSVGYAAPDTRMAISQAPSHRAPVAPGPPPAYATPDEPPVRPPATQPPVTEHGESLSDWIFASGDRDAG
jgi:hypothetical protein